MIKSKEALKAENDRKRHIAAQRDKPLSPPRAVPKSIPKKKGRPTKEEESK